MRGLLTHGAVFIDTKKTPLNTAALNLEATQTAMSAKLPATLGQKAMVASLAVVVASDQSPIPISAASLPLPTGAATEVTLASRLAEATFTARINTLGQKAMAASTPVVLASDQVAIPISSITTSVTPGTAAANLGKAEDTAHSTGDTGVFVLGVVNDLDADTVTANLEYIALATDRTGRVKVRDGTNLIATTISAANATVTLTIAAAGAGLFHYITGVEIVNVNPTATAIAGSAVTLSYTTTNIPGAPVWTEGNALLAGQSKVVERIVYAGGIKTTAANTATTFVAPAIGAGGVCRITVTYYVAP